MERLLLTMFLPAIQRRHTILFGFPHPSSANGQRAKQFEQNKHAMTETIKRWERRL
ncbi:hypothetical protein [Cytobacillus firmus]|uniref:Uncharacterized protein n=1 Tax=Cytobacillus firmus DS1 TaxID=1307436 RepID=W7L7Q4_CYTFI|nr:hypothetical protein [Cytobacillus firmus]EWG11297.1 hypothetical protein PBF_09742 [Cytobacillus firmus DS1]